MQHLDEGTIHAWLDGALAGDEHILIEQHVRDCADCGALVAEARGMIAGATRIVSALDGVPGGVIPPKQTAGPAAARPSVWGSLRLTPFRAGLAATVMIAVASMLAVRHDTPNKLVVSGPDMRPSVAAAPATPIPALSTPAVTRTSAAASMGASKNQTAEAHVDRPQRKAPALTAEASAASSGAAAAPPPPTNAALDQAVRSVSEKEKAATPPRLFQAPAAVSEAKVSAAADLRSRSDSAGNVARVVDSMVAGRGVAGGVAAKRAFAQLPVAQVTQLVETVVSSSPAGSPLLFIGCYRIVRDSLAPLSLVPDRFGLDQTGSPIRNVVRSINVSGGMDSVLATATWSSMTRGTAVVTWTDGLDREVLRLTMASTGVAAQAMVRGQSQSIGVTKLVCAR